MGESAMCTECGAEVPVRRRFRKPVPTTEPPGLSRAMYNQMYNQTPVCLRSAAAFPFLASKRVWYFEIFLEWPLPDELGLVAFRIPQLWVDFVGDDGVVDHVVDLMARRRKANHLAFEVWPRCL